MRSIQLVAWIIVESTGRIFGLTGPSLPPVRPHILREEQQLRRGQPLGEKPKWLDDAMQGSQEDEQETANPPLSISLQSGLAGFALHEQLGFCALLVEEEGVTTNPTSNNNAGRARSVLPVVISPSDTSRLESPESLTMVQLAGGMDLGTPILPPDLLARLVAEELEDNFSDDDNYDVSVSKLRPLVTLTGIRVLPNHHSSKQNKSSHPEPEQIQPSTLSSPPARIKMIQETLPKVMAAVQGLPGCTQVNKEQVLEAMQQFAHSETGMVDREAFGNILGAIRRPVPDRSAGLEQSSDVMFQLAVQLLSGVAIRSIVVDTTNALFAVGLSLRYKVPVQIDSRLDESFPSLALSETRVGESFPGFRFLQELYVDAKRMEGFIPSMFQRSQSLDNDMKE